MRKVSGIYCKNIPEICIFFSLFILLYPEAVIMKGNQCLAVVNDELSLTSIVSDYSRHHQYGLNYKIPAGDREKLEKQW